ncbi:hypothetical protein DL98DRAFT_541784 [Cadophora sp. DSE1049]|nr:hypothetical protein DL98DRAFT_541784 [Cadophora sp. DSE1049]
MPDIVGWGLERGLGEPGMAGRGGFVRTIPLGCTAPDTIRHGTAADRVKLLMFVYLVARDAHVPHKYFAVGRDFCSSDENTRKVNGRKELKPGTRHETGVGAGKGWEKRRGHTQKDGGQQCVSVRGRGSVQSQGSLRPRPPKDNGSAPPRPRIGRQLSIVEIRAFAQDNGNGPYRSSGTAHC